MVGTRSKAVPHGGAAPILLKFTTAPFQMQRPRAGGSDGANVRWTELLAAHEAPRRHALAPLRDVINLSHVFCPEHVMTLPIREKLAMLVPPSLFYPRRISEQARSGEPELALLAKLLPGGGTAVDVGANQGFFSYALSDIADRVIAFEPNPDYAFFARWMLRGRAEVHPLALSDAPGRGTLYVPISDEGMSLHFAGNLRRMHSQFRNIQTFDVEIRTLDEFGLTDVRFIKADVEGSEREVLDGARATIARDRPIILLELLSGTHADPAGCATAICEYFGYDAFIVQRGETIAALPAIATLGKNTSWGTEIESRNVLFRPR